MQLPDFIIISSYCRYIFSWESSNIFCCVISWQLVPKQYGMVFPSKPISLLHKLSGGFQQPLRCGSGHSFSFHLRSDWEDADAFNGKGETVGFFFLIQLHRGRWRKCMRLKVIELAFLFSSCFCFYGCVSEQVLGGERQLCKWDMQAKIRCFFTCIDGSLKGYSFNVKAPHLGDPLPWSVLAAPKKEWHRSLCSPRVLRLGPLSSHCVKHSLPCYWWEPAVLSPTLMQGNHHRGRHRKRSLGSH